jgi:glycosyltransferase involved in cell wall biosynthesis
VVSQKKVLMVSVAYYPSGIIGAHRGGKFAKYLRACGWEPVILTVREEFYPEFYPLVDERLREQIPEGAKLIRTGCFRATRLKHFLPGVYVKAKRSRVLAGAAVRKRQQEPDLNSWIEVPDVAFWIPYGLWHGLPAARECDVIWATSPPTAGLCVGAILSRLTGMPLVVDLRDPWRIDSVHPCATRLHQRLDRSWERFVLATAARIVTVTDHMADIVCRSYPQHRDKLTVIHNGYDAEDFSPIRWSTGDRTPLELTVGYFGVMSYGREDSLRAFLQLVGRLPVSPQGPCIRFVYRGPDTAMLSKLALMYAVQDRVDNGGFVSHQEALAMASRMDVLLVLSSNKFEYMLPAKLFDCLGAGKPVFAIAPEGALLEFVRQYDVGIAVDPARGESMDTAFQRLWDQYGHFRERVRDVATAFTRWAMTRKLAALLEGVVSEANHV